MYNSLQKLLVAWFRLTQRHSILFIVAIIILAAASLVYTANNLGMNTDTTDMLSPELQWRQLDQEYETLFPHTIDDLLIVLEAQTPDQAADAATELYDLLQNKHDSFKTVFSQGQYDFMKRSALLYLEPGELQDLADQLATNQPFLARLIADQNLRGLAGMLEEALEASADGEDVDLESVLNQLSTAFDANRQSEDYQLSWQKLLFEDEDKAVYREYIVVQPVLDYSNMFPGEAALTLIRDLAREAGIEDKYGVRLRFTGSVALSYEELKTVMQTNTLAIIGAFVFVAFVLTLGLGSGWLVLATLVTLIIGLILTAGFATLTVGELNLISVAFAVLYIGLGVDFAIHYCLRYRELLISNNCRSNALEDTSRDIGTALIICAFTTAIGFYAFIPTDYDGVAELGWISGSGMFISLLITMTFMPALLRHLPVKTKNHNANHSAFFSSLSSLPVRYGGRITTLAAIALIGSLLLIPGLEFDTNTLNLQSPENESVKTFKDLLREPGGSPLTGKVIARDLDDAHNIKHNLDTLPLVDKVVWLQDFIPEDQDDKLLLIDEMNLLLGLDFFQPHSPDIDRMTRHATLESLLDKIHAYNGPVIPGLERFKQALSEYLAFIRTLPVESSGQSLQTLERSLLSSLPGRLEQLEAGLETQGLALEDLPEEFVRRWKSGNRYLMQIYPVENLQDNSARYRFVEQIQAADNRATGGPVVTVEAGKVVVNAFTQAFVSAILVITVLLLLLMPVRIDALYVLAPLLLAALLTAAISVLTGMPLNFANIIALPLLLGIGVDSAIHIIHRYRTAYERGNLLATSSARAVFISALTTIGSIGNLAFSPHTGTASMGMLLTIGISMALLTSLFILPALLEYNNRR